MKSLEENAIQLIKIFAPLGLVGCPIFLIILIRVYFRDRDPEAFLLMIATVVGWAFDYWACRRYLGWFEKKKLK